MQTMPDIRAVLFSSARFVHGVARLRSFLASLESATHKVLTSVACQPLVQRSSAGLGRQKTSL